MNPQRHEARLLPYADVLDAVLEAIYDQLHIIQSSRFSSLSELEMLKRLEARTAKLESEKWAKHQTRNNRHLTEREPHDERLYDESLKIPRITRLCLEACNRAAAAGIDDQNGAIVIPSPLAILVDVLATPNRPESGGYGFSLARALLFDHFKVHPPAHRAPTEWHVLGIPEVQDAIETFRIYAKHRDNIHYSANVPTKAFLAHFLAMQGYLLIRFGTARKKKVGFEDAKQACMEFLKRKQFLRGRRVERLNYEFRLSPRMIDLPDTQEILNSLMGIPLTIAGAATIFFNGLQKSHKDSLVVSISGPPGTGKTSLALSLSSALAPFGTQCLYCSFEEDADTLRRRALGLVPQYFRRTTLPNCAGTDWLLPVALNVQYIQSLSTFSESYVSFLRESLAPSELLADAEDGALPGLAPLLIVIDSLTTIIKRTSYEQIDQFCAFVEELRALNCIVLLLSAEDIPNHSRLEYLVDTVINLTHEGTDSAKEKPVRQLKLRKTRLQMSRPGAHLLHLSGERGIRISPQVPSQLDSHKTHRTPLPEREEVIDTLWVDGRRSHNRAARLVDLYPRSRILLHGHGSSGKSSLAMKLLMAGTLDSAGTPVVQPSYRRARILIVSFLYPEEYYRENYKKLVRLASRVDGAPKPPRLKVIAFTPSFITPSDFIGRLLAEMDKGLLEGWPYTGILLDGLHNIFLQFPALQESDMVWPALYSLLSRYELTIVTTFTTFEKTHPGQAVRNREDDELILKGQLPFLHGLVQGTDFLFQIEPRELSHHDRRFPVTVKSAFGQRLPSHQLIWNANDFTFDGIEGKGVLPGFAE